jgi:Ceramidase
VPVASPTFRHAIEEPRILALLGLTVASLAGLLLLPPIAQDQSYHQFADQRTLLGTPNFWNVVSNFPFIAIGAAGLRQFRRDPATIVLFVGILLTGFGSSYYHLDPNNRTLFWDRLPMAISFMAILDIAIGERVNARAGAVLLWPLIAVGVFSLLLWRWTGDLRLYGWVQFFPCLALPLLFLLFPPKYTGTSYWLVAAALYALAKLFEFYDSAIYSLGSFLSGHTLKHLAAAAACAAVLRYFQKRRPIKLPDSASR